MCFCDCACFYISDMIDDKHKSDIQLRTRNVVIASFYAPSKIGV